MRMILFLITLMMLPFNSVYALDQERISTLMLTPEQRSLINKQRNSFLHKTVKKKAVKNNKKYIKKAKRISKKVTVSSVIVSPNGNKTIRINGNFVKQSAKNKSSKSAKLRIGSRTIDLPVGKTYLIKSKKIVDSHSQK